MKVNCKSLAASGGGRELTNEIHGSKLYQHAQDVHVKLGIHMGLEVLLCIWDII